MTSCIKKIAALLISLSASTYIYAATPASVRFADEASDTTLIGSVLEEASHLNLQSPNAWVIHFAKKLVGTPYKSNTIEADPEMLTVNMSEMDCTTYMETVLALSMSARDRRWSWRDFINYLESLRYRGGVVDGYASRLHYMSDWVIDNSSRGNIRDYTSVVGNAKYQIKSLDFMSTNRDRYPALKDENIYNQIRTRESAYRGHRFPYLAKGGAAKANLREGDIIMLVSKEKGLDISHVGFIVFVENKPYLLHASSKAGKVTIDKYPLDEYLRKQTSCSGIRVLRLSE